MNGPFDHYFSHITELAFMILTILNLIRMFWLTFLNLESQKQQADLIRKQMNEIEFGKEREDRLKSDLEVFYVTSVSPTLRQKSTI